jgi:transcriptional regulator with XRE-family HTH domain
LSTKRGRPTSPGEGAKNAVALVRALQKSLGINDQALADAAGMHQSSVSRALGRDPPALTPSLKILCSYAENTMSPTDSQHYAEIARSRLAEVAVAAWDGTPVGLNNLVSILELLGRYREDRER